MAERRKIIWDFQANTRDFDRDVRGSQRGLSQMERASTGVQRGMAGVTRAAGALGLAIGGREVAQFALDSAAMAEKAEIAGDALEKVLGPAADELRTRLDDTRRTLGFSRGEIDSMTSSLSLMATGMGASQTAAGELVGRMVEIGGDLAAFSGNLGEAERAVGAIGGALRGEFDPLEAFGVKLSEAKIQAEITRRQGLDPLFGSLSEGEQRLEAIIGLIEEGAAPALGALGDAAETTAGQQNQLNSRWKDFQEEIGGPINDQLNTTAGLLLDLAEAAEQVGDDSETAGDRIGDLNRAIGNIARQMVSVIPGAIQLWDRYTAAVREAWRAVGDLFSRLRNAPSAIGGVVVDRLSDVAGAIGGLIPGFQSGGVVPGPPSQAQLAVVHGGETITPGGAPGPTVVVNMGVVGDPDAAAQAIVDLLDRYERVSGQRPSGLGYAG